VIDFHPPSLTPYLQQNSKEEINPPPPPPPPHTPRLPLRAPVKVSGWWGMVSIMELGKPEKYPPLNPPPPKLKRKKWAFPLAA